MQIRAAAEADFERLWPLLRDVFRAGTTYAVDRDITAEQARAYWITTAAATFVAERDGAVLGTYYIRRNQPGGGAHICNCGYIVAQAARGQGIARAMCLHSQDQARALGFRAMQFNFVLASNTGALRLWRDLGFATLGTIPEAFDHPEQGMVDAVVMHKTL